MVRACHRDTCPVGIATQRQDLRAKFTGTPEKVARYLIFVAEETRRILASLGLRSLDEAIGRMDLLEADLKSDRANMLDVEPMMHQEEGIRHFVASHPIQQPTSELGDQVFDACFKTIMEGGEVDVSYPIHNRDRTIGARLGGGIAHEHGFNPPPGKATARFEGEAGQSFGAFLSDGVTFILTGEANDYVGKGMGGGRIVIRAPENDAGDPHLIGNTVLYGATGGQLFVAGRGGERLCIRNSGATAVVEGSGNHLCEYMTGGTVVCLGPTGSNVGAGMSGGELFVLDPTGDVLGNVNRQLVEAHRPSSGQLDELRALVAEHATVTGSARAAGLVEHWEDRRDQFWRVAPKSELERVAAGAGDATVG